MLEGCRQDRTNGIQIFLGGKLLGGADDLAQLIADNRLRQLLDQAKGKPPLPTELQEAVDSTAKTAPSDNDAVFVPPGMSRARYTELCQIAADLQHDFTL